MQEWLLQSVPILPAIRVLAVSTSFPVLAGPSSPRVVRVWVSLTLGLLLIPTPWAVGSGGLTGVALLLAAPLELMLGLAIGFAFSLVFHLLAIAGEFAGQEMGLNAATQIDPISGRPVPLLARLFETVGLVLFVESGGLALLLRTVRWSFEAVPPGAFVPSTRLPGTLVEACVSAMSLGITVAMPAGIVLLLLTTFTTITARTLPKLHIFDFAFATRMMAAIFLVSLLLPRLLPALDSYTLEIVDRLRLALGAR